MRGLIRVSSGIHCRIVPYHLTAAVALSPAGGAHDVIAGLADVPAPAPALGSLALVLLGAAAANRTLRLDRILTPAALRLLARAGTCGIDDLLAQGSPSLTAAGYSLPAPTSARC